MNYQPAVHTPTTGRRTIAASLRLYWPLIKSLQTILLVITGLGGYLSAHPAGLNWRTLLALAGSLLLAISGSTILNMVFDRDIDIHMKRTCCRPLPSGRLAPREASHVGLALSWLGIAWSFALSPLYGTIVSAGLLVDVVVYTLWLKRRTPWSILWGGISGGMPVLAGRVLGAGQVDLIGILLGLGVLTWIPSHIMPLTIKYQDDYRRAGVPTFPSTYGVSATRAIVSAAAVTTAAVMLIAASLSGVAASYVLALGSLGLVLLFLAIANIVRPTATLNLGLFKYASVYMLGAMVLMVMG